MNCHTLILTTTKTDILKADACENITQLINRGLALVEYFGIELDNDADYVDEDMEAVSKDITYIEIHFHTDEPIEYESLSETEVDSLVLGLMSNSEKKDIHWDGKDLRLYLHN